MIQSPVFILSGSPFLHLTHCGNMHFSLHTQAFPPLTLLRLVWFASPGKAWLEYYSQHLALPHRAPHTWVPALRRQGLQTETLRKTPRNAGQVITPPTSPPSSDCVHWVSTVFSTCWSCGGCGAWAELFPAAEWLSHADYTAGQSGLSPLLGYRRRQEQGHCPSSALRLGGRRPGL